MATTLVDNPAWITLKGAMHYGAETNHDTEGISSGVARDAFRVTNDPTTRVTVYVTASILYGLGWQR